MSIETQIELDAQYRQLREECGLFDRSGRGKLLVSGRDGAEYLQGQLTNDVEALAPGALFRIWNRKPRFDTDRINVLFSSIGNAATLP